MPALIELMFSTGCGVNHWRTETWAAITIGNVTATMAFLYSKIKTKFIQGLNCHRPVYGATILSYFARNADFYLNIPLESIKY